LSWTNCRSAALAAAAAGALACAPAAEAQERPFSERVFSLNAGYFVTWDDNVFRLPEGAPDPEAARGNFGKSDRYSTTSIGLHVNAPLAMQRFLLDFNKAAVRYDKFSSRDQDPLSYRGAWLWQLTSRLGGVISANRGETLVNVEDAEGRRRIEQRTTTLSASADWWMWSGWHLQGAVADSETKYDPPNLAQPDTKQKSVEGGVRYVARSASELALIWRSISGTETVGEAALLGGSDFTQEDIEARASWIFSGHSTLHARVTRTDRHNELLPQRDFSATSGELRHAWQITGKLNLEWSASRGVSPYNLTLQSSSRVDDTILAMFGWRATERIALRAGAQRQKSRSGQISSAFEARRDINDWVEAGVAWTPHRNISLDARFRHEERDSTDPLVAYDANVTSVGFSLRF
jgi:exopolysaccharide biosynthesis operon protein EpsL